MLFPDRHPSSVRIDALKHRLATLRTARVGRQPLQNIATPLTQGLVLFRNMLRCGCHSVIVVPVRYEAPKPVTASLRLAAGILMLTCTSCKKPVSATRPSTAPAASVPATVPTSAPAAAPASATFIIAGTTLTFASPCVSLDKDASQPRLLLYCEQDEDAGSYYFEIPVEPEWTISDPIVFEQQLHESDREDSLVGIQLPGRSYEPESLHISVKPISARIVQVDLKGEFTISAAETPDLASHAKVQATFQAAVRE